MTTEVLPPFDIAAEEATIAALLLDESSFWLIDPLLKPGDFFREQHEWIYEACAHLAARGETIAVTTVCHELSRTLSGVTNRLDQIGGEPAIVELVGRHFTSVGSEAFARIVARDALYRRLIQSAGMVASMAYEGGADEERVLNAAARLIENVRAEQPSMGALTSEQIVNKLIEQQFGETETTGNRTLTSGYRNIDALTGGGYAPGEIITIGASTSVGKTQFALGAAERQALQGLRVGYIPVEGNRDTLIHRIASRHATFQMAHVLQAKNANSFDYEHMRDEYREALLLAGMLPISWPDRYIDNVGDICSWISVQAHQTGMQVAYIDHVDVVRSARQRDSRANEMADIMRTIQNTARRENVAIVCLSQVNRAATKSGKAPKMRDLLDSGVKEQVSQVILMLHGLAAGRGVSHKRLMVTVDKNTEGRTGVVYRQDQDERNTETPYIFSPRSNAIEELGVDE